MTPQNAPPVTASATLPPLALYAHFPWCVRKCPYCDFNSYTLKDELPEARYIDALRQDLEAQIGSSAGVRARLAEREIVSVFLGGGTPSLFPPQAIARFLENSRALLRFAPDVEITLEANPGTVERGRFSGYRDAGVNRVSLGAQSFDGARLAALGRIHSADETRLAAAELQAAGLDNFNLDLMYALPGQTPDEALADLRAALALQPQHISHYHLTMEPGTPFAANPPVQPPDEVVEEMLSLCQQELADAGFAHYEVSAYARAGRRARHNLNYWQFGDYLGIGAGAHGKITNAAGDILRTTQLREPRKYLGAVPLARSETPVSDAQRPFEFMMNALRLIDGFESPLYEARTGLTIADLAPKLKKLADRGLLESSNGGWRATARGQRFLNDVLLEFLDEPSSAISEQNRLI